MNNIHENTKLIKSKAKELGFDDCGISKIETFNNFTREKYNEWINSGFSADMQYMERNIDKRFDITKMVENAKSVISVILNYYPEVKQNTESYKISKYAYGYDYHKIIKDKLYKLFNFINNEISKISGRVFVDSAPVMEKQWAVKSGLGWQGKNSCLINKDIGSFFFVGEIVIDLELEYDKPINEYCGNCTKCIDACPTGAIEKPYVVNSNKCISYLTIEHKGEFNKNINIDFTDYIFGCDICQDVCPWNAKPVFSKIKEFKIFDAIKTFTYNNWENLNENDFNKIFKNSPLKRTKYSGIKRNINQLKKKSNLHPN